MREDPEVPSQCRCMCGEADDMQGIRHAYVWDVDRSAKQEMWHARAVTDMVVQQRTTHCI